MVIEYNHFCYVNLEDSTISAQWRLHLWGQSEAFTTSTISSWVFSIPWYLLPALFVGFSLHMFLFRPLVMFVNWMVHVYYIKFPFRHVLGSPIPILAIPGYIILWFLDSPGLNMVKSLNISLVGVPSFIVVVGTGLYFDTS